MKVLVASHVSVEDEGGVLAVYFRGATDGLNEYAMLQLETEPDEQSRSLRMDGIYFEINDQGHSGYNVIDEIEIRPDRFCFHFNSKAIRLAEADSPLIVQLSDEQGQDQHAHNLLAEMAEMANIKIRRHMT